MLIEAGLLNQADASLDGLSYQDVSRSGMSESIQTAREVTCGQFPVHKACDCRRKVDRRTEMKIERVLCCVAIFLMVELAFAKMPFSSEVLGKAEGTLDYCAHIDAASAARYQLKKKDLVKGVPEEEVTQARKTDEYKAGYQWISDELPKMPKEEVSNACTASLETKN